MLPSPNRPLATTRLVYKSINLPHPFHPCMIIIFVLFKLPKQILTHQRVVKSPSDSCEDQSSNLVPNESAREAAVACAPDAAFATTAKSAHAIARHSIATTTVQIPPLPVNQSDTNNPISSLLSKVKGKFLLSHYTGILSLLFEIFFSPSVSAASDGTIGSSMRKIRILSWLTLSVLPSIIVAFASL